MCPKASRLLLVERRVICDGARDCLAHNARPSRDVMCRVFTNTAAAANGTARAAATHNTLT